MKTGTVTALLGVLAALALASSSARAAECSNEAVRGQQGSTYLPECRGYELVSPTDKNGEEVEVSEQYHGEVPFQAGETGSSVTYTFTGGIPGGGSAGLYIQGLSTFVESGKPWSLKALPPESIFGVLQGPGPRSAGEWVYFAPDLSCALLRTRLPQAARPGEEQPIEVPHENAGEQPDELYMWSASSDTRTLVSNALPESLSQAAKGNPANLSYEVDGASEGCRHVIFENREPGYNLPGAPETSIYEWTAGGEPRVASVLPDGKDAAFVEDPESGNQHPDYHQISADGKRVFFTATSDGGAPGEAIDSGAPQIYVRENGSTTTELSGSQTETAVRDGGAVFQGATKDGSRVFFLANYGLTARTSASEGAMPCQRDAKSSQVTSGTGCDLYEYDLETKTLTDLSADVQAEAHKADKSGADVRGVLGFSEDGSYVYFSAAGQLEGLGQSEEENLAKHEANVFVNHDGRISYVATIEEEEAGGGKALSKKGETVEPGTRATAEIDAIANSAGFGMHYDQARVSPNGQFALFATHKRLTSYENLDANTGKPDPEFYEYRYSEGAGTVSCISCNTDGERPAMTSAFFNPQGPFLYVYNGVLATTLLDDGRAYFQSSDALVPQARRPEGPHGEAPVQPVDVYQWRPVGADGCEVPTAKGEGCVDLLDDGQGAFPTYLIGASRDGRDVYVTTHSALALQDQDGSRDMYDVRVGGGVLFEAASPNCEATEAGCQSASTSGTSSAHGSEAPVENGNLLTPAPKGEVEGFKEAAVRVAKHSTKGSTLRLVIAAPGAGRLTVTGRGLQKRGKVVSRAGSYTLELVLAKKGRAAVKHHRKVRVKVLVSFASSTGKASSVTLSVVFR